MTPLYKHVTYRQRKTAFYALGLFCVALLVLYVYLVGHTVYAGVELQKIGRAVREIQGDADALEERYLTLKGDITAELARLKGFTEIASTVRYITRGAGVKNLSLK